MDTLERLLALRPTNAAARLGHDSALPLLNPRDVLRSLESEPAAVACLQIPADPVFAAVLRAARDLDSVLGLSSPYRPAQREAPARSFEALRVAAEETAHRKPIFLQAGPLRLTSLEGRAVEAAAGDVFRFIDAGFTLISLDVSMLDPEQALQVAEVARPAIERELAIEVAPPRGASGHGAAEELGRFLDALAQAGLRPNLVRISSRTVVPDALPGAAEPEPDFEYLREISHTVRDQGALLALEDHGTPIRRLSAWAAAGVKKVDLSEPFARRVLQVLPPDTQTALRAKAQSARMGLGELLAQLGDPLAAVTPAERDRVEALCYGEACDVLEAMAGKGTATRCARFLADQAGY